MLVLRHCGCFFAGDGQNSPIVFRLNSDVLFYVIGTQTELHRRLFFFGAKYLPGMPPKFCRTPTYFLMSGQNLPESAAESQDFAAEFLKTAAVFLHSAAVCAAGRGLRQRLARHCRGICRPAALFFALCCCTFARNGVNLLPKGCAPPRGFPNTLSPHYPPIHDVRPALHRPFHRFRRHPL